MDTPAPAGAGDLSPGSQLSPVRSTFGGMATFRHRMSGPGPAGDIWVAGWYSVSSQTLASVHTAFDTWVQTFIGTTMLPLWATETQLTDIETDELDPTTGHNVSQVQTAENLKGTGTGFQLPQRSAVVVGMRTALPTRSGRGRFYLPAPDSTNITTTGLLISATATTISSGAASAFGTFMATAQPVIYHRNKLNPPPSTTPVTTVTVGVVLGSQRRRTNKVAPAYSSHGI